MQENLTQRSGLINQTRTSRNYAFAGSRVQSKFVTDPLQLLEDTRTLRVAPSNGESGKKGGCVMADKKNIHTVPTEDGWANRREGGQRASSTHDTKSDAQAAGRAAAKKDGVEHLVHKKDGSIGERNSYGNDPHPPKG